ncbi:halocyanin domain-containing protein [Haladaptatus sp. NG-SE-30]
MQPKTKLTRRNVLQTTAVAGGSLLLAGCLGSSGANEPTDSESGGDQTDDTTEKSSDDSSDKSSDGSSAFGDWFEDVPNYDSVSDETGTDKVTVTVGADANNGFTFAPPAIKVSTGTTVVWEWSGKGGSHNVVDQDGAFESKMVGEKGHTFEHTFSEAGTYKYYCEPHKAMGMKGGILVE